VKKITGLVPKVSDNQTLSAVEKMQWTIGTRSKVKGTVDHLERVRKRIDTLLHTDTVWVPFALLALKLD